LRISRNMESRTGCPIYFWCRHFWKMKFWVYSNYYKYFRYIK